MVSFLVWGSKELLCNCQLICFLNSWIKLFLNQLPNPSNDQCYFRCHEASDLNNTSARRRRLDTVAQMFEDAYVKAVLSKPINSSGTLSSLIGNVAEKMGFRSGPRWGDVDTLMSSQWQTDRGMEDTVMSFIPTVSASSQDELWVLLGTICLWVLLHAQFTTLRHIYIHCSEDFTCAYVPCSDDNIFYIHCSEDTFYPSALPTFTIRFIRWCTQGAPFHAAIVVQCWVSLGLPLCVCPVACYPGDGWELKF